MSNSYNYIDPDYTYTDPKTGILRNLADISDESVLIFVESRTQKEFIRLLALEKDLSINLNPPDNESIYKRYMSGTINSEVDTLASLIFELIQ